METSFENQATESGQTYHVNAASKGNPNKPCENRVAGPEDTLTAISKTGVTKRHYGWKNTKKSFALFCNQVLGECSKMNQLCTKLCSLPRIELQCGSNVFGLNYNCKSTGCSQVLRY